MRSVFHPRRWTCQLPRANAVIGMRAKASHELERQVVAVGSGANHTEYHESGPVSSATSPDEGWRIIDDGNEVWIVCGSVRPPPLGAEW